METPLQRQLVAMHLTLVKGWFARCLGYTNSYMTNHLEHATCVSVCENQGHLVSLLEGM